MNLIMAIVIMFAVIALREWTHHIHDTRRDKLISELTDKIKAKDFVEYTDAIKPAATFEAVSKSDEEMYWEEIEESKV